MRFELEDNDRFPLENCISAQFACDTDDFWDSVRRAYRLPRWRIRINTIIARSSIVVYKVMRECTKNLICLMSKSWKV